MSIEDAKALQQQDEQSSEGGIQHISTVTMSIDDARAIQQAAAVEQAKKAEAEEEEVVRKEQQAKQDAEQAERARAAEEQAAAAEAVEAAGAAEEPDHRALKMIPRAKAHPKGGPDIVFVIHRSNNTNCVCYKGDAAKGVEVLWIMFEKKGEPTEGLTFAEKKTAYGFTCKPNGTGEWALKMKALSDREITISCVDGAWVAKTRIGQVQDATLRAVHVEMKKQMIPAVKHIEIFGIHGAYELKKP
jgi:hypothetical protein